MSTTLHKIQWIQSGTHDVFGDWDCEYEITYKFTPGTSSRRFLTTGDAGPLIDDDIIEFVSVSPDAGDHGAFSDLAQRSLETQAADYVESDAFDNARDIALRDLQQGLGVYA